MKERSTPAQIKACRALALERNRQLFDNAHTLNRAANAMLEVENLDMEQFEHYRALRKKADLLFEDAVAGNNNLTPLRYSWERHPHRDEGWKQGMISYLGEERFKLEYEVEAL